MSGWGFPQINDFAAAATGSHTVIFDDADHRFALYAGRLMTDWWTARRTGKGCSVAAPVTAVRV